MSKKQPLYKASEIIDRFGGIRPMAALIDTPVTTVQGWKKRDVIPGTRRETILQAAQNNDVNIDDLAAISEPAPSATSKKKPVKKSATKKSASKKTVKKKPVKKTPDIQSEKQDEAIASNYIKDNSDDIDSEIIRSEKDDDTEDDKTNTSVPAFLTEEYENKETAKADQENLAATPVASIPSAKPANSNVITAIWLLTAFALLATAIALYFIVPKMKANDAIIKAQSQKLVALEEDVRSGIENTVQTKDQNGFMGASLPENLEEKIDSLQNQARNISVTVDQLSEKAKELSAESYNKGAEKLSSQMQEFETRIEEKLNTLSPKKMTMPSFSFTDLKERIDTMSLSESGRKLLAQANDRLSAILPSDNNEEVMMDNLEAAQEEDSALGSTLMGVPKEDLKAAAMLIAFSQFRSSLDREESFDKDLDLLKKLVGDDNPELQSNLDRLSIHADDGVLTTAGLATALKQMTGDIVVSSLNGEDISIKEKAKARFGDLVQIEKDGVPVSGTETQKTLSRAQDVLEKGEIEESVVLLESLEGNAEEAAKPIIEEAKALMLAEKTKAMFEEKFNAFVSNSGVNSGNFDLKTMRQSIEDLNPYRNDKIVRDPNSDMIILQQ